MAMVNRIRSQSSGKGRCGFKARRLACCCCLASRSQLQRSASDKPFVGFRPYLRFHELPPRVSCWDGTRRKQCLSTRAQLPVAADDRVEARSRHHPR